MLFQPVKSVECANTAKAVVVNVNSEEKPKQVSQHFCFFHVISFLIWKKIKVVFLLTIIQKKLVNSNMYVTQALSLSPDSKDQSLSAPKDEVVIKVPVVTQIDDRTFQPIQPIDDTINDTLNDTVPFEEEELEDIMNNMSLLANVSQTEPDIEEVDNDVNHDNQLNQSISAAFSYRR